MKNHMEYNIKSTLSAPIEERQGAGRHARSDLGGQRTFIGKGPQSMRCHFQDDRRQ